MSADLPQPGQQHGVRARVRASHLGSCKLFRQMAHVSVTTFQDHTATAFHFFILMNGLLSWNAGSPGLGAGAAAVAAPAAAEAAAADEDSVGVLAAAALASAAALSDDARADARVVRCLFVGLLSAIPADRAGPSSANERHPPSPARSQLRSRPRARRSHPLRSPHR